MGIFPKFFGIQIVMPALITESDRVNYRDRPIHLEPILTDFVNSNLFDTDTHSVKLPPLFNQTRPTS